MKYSKIRILMLAGLSMLAGIVVSCASSIGEAEEIDLSAAPSQAVDDMFAVQSDKGIVKMRIEAPRMESYDTDTTTTDVFPKGLSVFGYTEEGLLETVIVSDNARHIVSKSRSKDEIWQAFGNVVIHNVIKRETMETDTLYWDSGKNEIYTDCYIKMYSPDGFMQGYGMRSDDHARNAILHKPFNSYGVSIKDTTAVFVDSVNFIGPALKK